MAAEGPSRNLVRVLEGTAWASSDAAPGYGPRDPLRDAVPRERWERGRLRARIEFVLTALAFGTFGLSPVIACVVTGRLGMLPIMVLANPHLVIPGAIAFAFGVWYAAMPVVSWDESGLVLRHVPWRAAARVRPAEVTWRPGARYVGRYLIALPHGRRPTRFPLWMIRRGGARRLFAALDHALGVPG